MNDHDFVSSVHTDILDANISIYRQLLTETNPNDASDPYWKELLRFYGNLNDSNKETVQKVVRQIMVDTISNIFSVLDGNQRLPKQTGDFKLLCNGKILNGSLQDLFLEMDENGHR